jgi:hypothetical protein
MEMLFILVVIVVFFVLSVAFLLLTTTGWSTRSSGRSGAGREGLRNRCVRDLRFCSPARGEHRRGAGLSEKLARRRWTRVLLLAALTVALTLILAGCGGANSARDGGGTTAGSDGAEASAATQTNEGGEVTVAVTWKGPSAGPVFDVAVDTHSVDLDGYDLTKLAVLRNDRGKEVRPSGWDAPKGGHHREGTLAFPEKAPDGSPVIGSDTRRIELIIRDVAGVPERKFEWIP